LKPEQQKQRFLEWTLTLGVIPVRIDVIKKFPRMQRCKLHQSWKRMVSETKENIADYQEHNIPSWKSLAKTNIIVVLRFSPIEQT
jgi:Ca2+-dependent lipid-binding protein